MNIQNRLSQSGSPYLRQHAGNPVDWYEWGEEALTKAEKENKPLIISIGYAACHWCHVMAHESFSDEGIARFMNEHFVCIKVDREERPDIDQIYMEAAQLLTGRGGWPLNAFALPDGRPFYAGTYFPPEQWLDAMKQLIHLFQTQYERVLHSAKVLTEGIRLNPLPETTNSKPLAPDEYHVTFRNLISAVDFELGGFGGAPKFMMPIGLEFLLQYHYLTGEQQALIAVTTTLDAMAKGGIYDQLGGGFARYSTDQYWKVPHFEKMLYDNAQLISLYAHAFQLTRKKLYADIVGQTIMFAERELLGGDGGFYASIDADSEHEEGKFYVWTQNEIESALDPVTADIFNQFYNITREGNWEPGKNILYYSGQKTVFAKRYNMTEDQLDVLLKKAGDDLLTRRSQRIRPATDDKMLTAWNALMLSALVNAYKALGKEQYLKAALRTARFLENNMIQVDGSVFRVVSDKNVSTQGFLDDYALLADALISLYEVTFDLHWLELSERLTEYVLKHFADTSNHLFFYTSDLAKQLVARKHELSDNVIPASNSVFAHVLHKLGILFENGSYSLAAEQMLLKIKGETSQHSLHYSNWAMLMGKHVFPVSEVVIMGENVSDIRRRIQENYLPVTIFAGGSIENLPLLKQRSAGERTVIYVCRDKTCERPVYSADEALTFIHPA